MYWAICSVVTVGLNSRKHKDAENLNDSDHAGRRLQSFDICFRQILFWLVKARLVAKVMLCQNGCSTNVGQPFKKRRSLILFQGEASCFGSFLEVPSRPQILKFLKPWDKRSAV